MAWHAVYEVIGGKLLSVGSTVVDPLPTGAAKKEYAERPDVGKEWDPVTLDFVPSTQPRPDPVGFWRSLVGEFGRSNVNTFMQRFPDFRQAMERENYIAAREILDGALVSGDLTAAQHTALTGHMNAHDLGG